MKGDQLRAKRALFRIQQEETLLRVGEAVRRKVENKPIEPVPPKILVPALEKASLESPLDEVMIEKWANLLASASQKMVVQPRFVSILGELAGSQAECLEVIAFNNFEMFDFPASDFEGSPYEFAEYARREDMQDEVGASLKARDAGETFERLVSFLTRPGVFLEIASIDPLEEDDGGWEYDNVSATGVRRESDLAILESLGIIRRVTMEFFSELNSGAPVRVSIHYCHLTQLGVEFCQVCSQPRCLELDKINEESRAAGKKHFYPRL